ncbi:hypothetical protein [Streptomyces sp. AK02-01A]|uniref:hypothetical protein n=1 Tax=Streptomyces sp. AK02-01A TaxID=3028648 RepID=UPI0029A3834B|nr:hypothetical protein [Streptomyces sp. AK02-01A]MDX3852522.1 hypothetical protein [Streptomyces sp. AK02-01A]
MNPPLNTPLNPPRTPNTPLNTPRTPHTPDAPASTGPDRWDFRFQTLLPGEPPTPAARPPEEAAGPAAPSGAAARNPAARRGPVDPVRTLMHRHRLLCEQAVDPLEIAAGLEAHGITDRTAARFRHRDVFSLAEELYARVPRGTDLETAGRPATGADSGAGRDGRAGWTDRSRWAVLALLPGVVCSLTLVALAHSSGQRQLAIALAGACALSGTLSACLRRGPLRAEGRRAPAAGLWVYWLLAFLLCGEAVLDRLAGDGPGASWSATLTPLAVLACSVAPAAWCARLFSVQARRRLTDSRGLADFAAGARPLLLAAVGLYAAALTGLSLLAAPVFGDDEPGALAPTVTLGTLLFLARLLTVHGFPEPAATGLAAACAVEALACASAPAGRLPGGEFLAVPVRALVRDWGGGTVSALACGAAALGLLTHAAVALSRASAHR